MKTLLIVGVLLCGLGGQAFSMGHPHNVFAARKQMRAKTAASVARSKTTVCTTWEPVVKIDKAALSNRLLNALSQLRPSQSY